MFGVISVISNPAAWGKENLLGGAEIKAVNILKRWHSYGVHVHTLETYPSISKLMGANYDVHTVCLPIRLRGIIPVLLMMPILFLKFISKLPAIDPRQIDAVIASTSNLSDVAPAWFISKVLRKPLIVAFTIVAYATSASVLYRKMKEAREEPGIIDSLLITLSSLIMLKLSKSAFLVFALSEPVAEVLRALGFPNEKLYITGVGLEHDQIDESPEGQKEYDGVFLGRVVKSKGVEDLINAWNIVVKSKPYARLLVIGSGSFMEKARRLIAHLGIENNVKFTGFVRTAKRFSYLKASKIFIFPSKFEGWALAVAEALACGLSVVCYEIPVFKKNFKECESVLMVQLGDTRELADAILRLLDDEEALRRNSEISKKFARKFDWDQSLRSPLGLSALSENCR